MLFILRRPIQMVKMFELQTGLVYEPEWTSGDESLSRGVESLFNSSGGNIPNQIPLGQDNL